MPAPANPRLRFERSCPRRHPGPTLLRHPGAGSFVARLPPFGPHPTVRQRDRSPPCHAASRRVPISRQSHQKAGPLDQLSPAIDARRRQRRPEIRPAQTPSEPFNGPFRSNYLCPRPFRAVLPLQRHRATAQLARRRCDCDCARPDRISGNAGRPTHTRAAAAVPVSVARDGAQRRWPRVAGESSKPPIQKMQLPRPPLGRCIFWRRSIGATAHANVARLAGRSPCQRRQIDPSMSSQRARQASAGSANVRRIAGRSADRRQRAATVPRRRRRCRTAATVARLPVRA